MFQTANSQGTSTSSLPTTRLHFPQPWLDENEGFASIQQIEVRKAPTSSDNEFFFGALPDGDNFYAHEVDKNMPKPRYGTNIFTVNFSAGLKVRTATQQEWESASRIPAKPKHIFPKSNYYSSGEIEYKQHRYERVGKYWGNSSLSPTGKWLAAFSYTGEKPPPDLFGQGNPRAGDIFLQIYDTGRKSVRMGSEECQKPRGATGAHRLALDNPTLTRFATKEEWDRAQTVRSYRSEKPPNRVAKTVKGTIPPYRKFPKSGVTWGSPQLLSADEWIAIFSYTEEMPGRGRPAGKMFVDIYDQRLGHKLLSTVLPFSVSPDELLQNALWIEGGYMMLPLNASLDSFAFWQLPGGR